MVYVFHSVITQLLMETFLYLFLEKVSSDNDLMLNLTIPFFSLEHLCDEHLLWYLFPRRLRRYGTIRPCPFCLRPRRVCVRLFQLSQKKLLGNRNGHYPGSPSGKWNPESGSLTANHTFVSLIHFSHCCAARKAWGRWAQTDTKYVCWETDMAEERRRVEDVWKLCRARVQPTLSFL